VSVMQVLILVVPMHLDDGTQTDTLDVGVRLN